MIVPRLVTAAFLAAILVLVTAPAATPQAGQDVPPGMAAVEGGEFEMGMPIKTWKKEWKDRQALLDLFATETDEHEVTVAGYWLDKYEVTNAQYLVYLDDAHKTVMKVEGNLNTLIKIAVEKYGPTDEMWWEAIYHMNWQKLNPEKTDVTEPDAFPGGLPDPAIWANKGLPDGTELVIYEIAMPRHWINYGTIPPEIADHPVRWMSWAHANAFATWAGKHIPTEVEWERAARGPSNSVYPWGGDWRNFDWPRREERLNWALLRANHPARNANPAILTTPVGSFEDGKSGYGIYDMLGNVWEWTDTVFHIYPGCKLEAEDWWKEALVVRGGAYNSVDLILRNTFRTGGDGKENKFRPEFSAESFGFRCARWPVPGADRAYQTWRTMERAKRLPKHKNDLIEFSRSGGIGAETVRFEEKANHVYVSGRSRSIAILPRLQIPESLIKDLKIRSEKAEKGLGVVVGLLHSDLDLEVYKEKSAEPGAEEVLATAPAGDYILVLHLNRLRLLKTNLAGTESVGYLLSAKKREEAGDVVKLGKLDAASSQLVSALDQIKIEFAVDRRAGGQSFVFQAIVKTAAKGVLNVDWKTTK